MECGNVKMAYAVFLLSNSSFLTIFLKVEREMTLM